MKKNHELDELYEFNSLPFAIFVQFVVNTIILK